MSPVPFRGDPPLLNITLLTALRQADGAFVSPSELGADPLTVARDIDALIDFGFPIERDPQGRSAYRGPAPRLCPDQIEHQLEPHWIGHRIAVWRKVSSTNDLAAQASRSRSNAGLVVLAEEQTRGRGRRGRAWVAPPGTSILMSVLIFPPPRLVSTLEQATGLAWLTALAAVAAAETAARWTSEEPSIKWPNDVRVGARKIAGVLVERAAGGGAVIGVGLNVNLAVEQFPPELRLGATSIQLEHGRPVDRSEVARTLIRRLDHWYDLSLAHGPGPLTEAWRARCEHLGRLVEVATPAGRVTGFLIDLDPETGATLRTLPTHEPLPSHTQTTIPLAHVLNIQEWSQDPHNHPIPHD